MQTGTGVARGKGRVKGAVLGLKMRNQQRGRAYGATLQNWLATDPIDPIPKFNHIYQMVNNVMRFPHNH
jgi:hypothetical protein